MLSKFYFPNLDACTITLNVNFHSFKKNFYLIAFRLPNNCAVFETYTSETYTPFGRCASLTRKPAASRRNTNFLVTHTYWLAGTRGTTVQNNDFYFLLYGLLVHRLTRITAIYDLLNGCLGRKASCVSLNGKIG